MNQQASRSFSDVFRERVSALRNIPPVLRIVWSTAPSLVGWGIALRVTIAVLPLALLAVARLIINGVVPVVERHQTLPARFWWLVGLEFAIAVVIGLLGRLLTYFDAVLADRYTHSISVRSSNTLRSSI